SGAPICSVEPELLQFCCVRIGVGGEELPFTITNTGDGLLEGRVFDDPPYYTFRDYSNECAYSLGQDESATVWVVFDPPDLMGREGALVFESAGCDTIVCYGWGQPFPDVGEPYCMAIAPNWNLQPVMVGTTVGDWLAIYNVGGGVLNGTLPDSCGPFVLDWACDFEVTDYVLWMTWFTPTVAGHHSCQTALGTDCGDLVFTGMAYYDYPSCQVDVDTLDFGAIQVGTTGYEAFHIMNTGNTMLTGLMQFCGDFHVTQGAFYEIPFAEEYRFVAGFTPTAPGRQECVLDTGNGLCSDIVLIGTGIEPSGAEDVIGLYFDESGQQNSYVTTEPNEIVTAYLLILNPSIPYGVSGWECCVEAEGGVVSMWWDLAGETVNVATPPCFAVGISGSPLLGEHVIQLATMHFIQSDPGVPTNFYIHPTEFPSIPGVPVYAHGADPGILLPLGWSSGAEELPVAKVNDLLSDETTPERTTRLLANYPNPFNPSTSIAFELARDCRVSLAVYDLSGRQIRSLADGQLDAGEHRREWDGLGDRGRSVSSGVYCYQLVAEEYRATRRMVLLR
ncbi:MAG: FlgD immunoglobulin-like domain containing protein, partial [bacterium]